ncbi:MAG: potassium channel protein [Anaerolineae bacterium]|nr:potassium channel protein [Anaerolineae bacterium]
MAKTKKRRSQKSIGQQVISYVCRPVLAYFRMPGSKTFGILFVLFATLLVVAVADLEIHYVHPETGQRLDTMAAAYAVLTLLVFENAFPLPDSWMTRLIFFIVPISGILVLGQGIIRLGSNLLNRDTWNRAMASTYKNHTIVCGLGKVSARVVRWIVDMNEEAVVIENNPANRFVEEVRSWGVPIIIGDARRAEVLKDAAIGQAESIVPCTNDDLINLSIALEARRLVPKIKVVLRMFDVEMAENVRAGFGIHTAFSIPELSAPAFAAAATRVPLDYAFSYGEGDQQGLLTITNFTLVEESTLNGYTVGQLEAEFNVAVIAHRCAGKFNLHPPDDTVLSAGDRFVLSASIKALKEISHLTPPTREMDRYQQGRWSLKTKT